MGETCKLEEAAGASKHCEGDTCVYWRVADHLGLVEAVEGCAIQHFGILDGGEDIALWLMSVKSRVERPRADA